MGTACYYGFKKGNKLKFEANYYDSYPSEFGRNIVAFIKENTIEELNYIFENTVIVNGDDYPSNEQISEMISKKIKYKDQDKIFNWRKILYLNKGFNTYYVKKFLYICNIDMIDLKCMDYLYIINLNTNKFEIYEYTCDKANTKLTDDIILESHFLEEVYDLNNIPKDWFYRE